MEKSANSDEIVCHHSYKRPDLLSSVTHLYEHFCPDDAARDCKGLEINPERAHPLVDSTSRPCRCRVYWLCKEVLSEEMRTPMREVETNSLSELFTYAQSTAPNGQRHACNVRSSSNDEATFTLALGACAREDTIEKQPEFFANAGADEVANRN